MSKYNGKELQTELGLNYTSMDFRNYDNAIGRFINPDRLTELAPMHNPYRFAFNNPVYFRDPTGLFERRKDARRYKKENGIIGQISKDSDGTFTIYGKGEEYGGRTYTRPTGEMAVISENALDEDGVLKGTYVIAARTYESNWLSRDRVITREFAESWDNEYIESDSRGWWARTFLGNREGVSASGVEIYYDRDGKPYPKPVTGVAGGDLIGGPGKGVIQSFRVLKAINIPSWKKITVDLTYILSGHTTSGIRAMQSGNKTLFSGTNKQILNTIESACNNSKKIKTQGDRIKLRGTSSSGVVVEMWLNTKTKILETAYPI